MMLLLTTAPTALALERYVNVNNPSPAAPYTTWASAATSIQAAVDAAVAGDQIVVSNGLYATGGRAVYGAMTNRVAINKAVTVRSVNGPAVTIIEGRAVPGTTNGNSAIRCAYVGVNGVLSGFTLTNGHTRTTGDSYKEQSGGGAWCETSAVVTNCVLTGNSAYIHGGGAYSGTLNNCALTGNSARSQGGGAYQGTLNNCMLTANSAIFDGGGARSGTLNNCVLTGNSTILHGGGAAYGMLNNCTLSGNSANEGGGSYQGTLNNCIAYYNSAPSGPNYSGSTLKYSCATPLPSGPGNLDTDPLLASVHHLSAQSPCIGQGSSAYSSGVDIDGENWLNPPCMGADQFVSGQSTSALSMAITANYTNVAAGFAVPFTAWNSGRISDSAWDFGDGVVVSNRAYVSHAWAAPGLYLVRLTGYNGSWPGGVSVTTEVHVVEREVYYANASNSASVYPYTNWANAATNIQDAIDAGSQIGRLVLVTDGLYATGGRAVNSSMTNRVVVVEGMEVRSVNGPLLTIIEGATAPGGINGDGAIRCVYVGANAVLSGFTLTNGHTRTTGDSTMEQSGGGAWCVTSAVVTNCVLTGNSANSYGGGASSGTLNNCSLSGNSASDRGGGVSDATLNNCTLIGNSANSYGGGAASGALNNCTLTGNSANEGGGGSYQGTLKNCTLTSNSANFGGGAFSGTLKNCTLIGNSALNGGGAHSGTLNNCIAYYNTAPNGPNYSGSTLKYSCATPLPSGPGNLDTDPLLASVHHLSAQSPCISQGSSAYSSGVDIDGENWLNPPCIGADQFVSGLSTGALTMSITANYTNVAAGFAVSFTAWNSGRISDSAWDFGDGTVVSNRAYVSHAWAAPGLYLVRLTGYNESWPNGVSVTTVVHVVEREMYYVNASNTAPVYPYTNWTNAATNIQEAIDAGSQIGRLVLATNGLYATGGRAVNGAMTNRVVIAEGVEVRSVNGPAVTIIEGATASGGGNGDGAIRCAYAGTNAVLSGFTLTNGHTRTTGDGYKEQNGGGAWCETSAVVTNCVLTGNSANSYGGGAYQATLNNCTLTGNSAGYVGGGAYSGTLNNCTLTGNSASTGGGGAFSGTLNNCIAYYNSAPTGPNYYDSTLNYSCATPLPSGPGNIQTAPAFTDTNGWSNLRLQSNSPCINAGYNAYASGTDLDGLPRIVGGTVDMGAYEFQSPASVISHAWLQQYGLPTDGSADYGDTEPDGMNNWQEWIAGTVPTNAASALRMLTLTNGGAGLTASWSSVTDRTYWLERATNLSSAPVFGVVRSNVAGLSGSTSVTDSNAVGPGPFYYRVGVAR